MHMIIAQIYARLERENLLLQASVDAHVEYVNVAGSHLDGKNTPGSYSALIVFETGEPFCGSYYMLPQYHMGLDVRQGQQPVNA